MLPEISYVKGNLTEQQQAIVNDGFEQHSAAQSAPAYQPEKMHWKVETNKQLVAVLTANQLWDWLYIDELWVADDYRHKGYGKELMHSAEAFSQEAGLCGLWLWTQSWQAADFYKKLGYKEFTVFEDFPRGYNRIGLRKTL